MKIFKKISLIILIAGYLIAGANHFYNPVSYYHIIPKYLPFPVILNILAGVFEILFAILLISPKTRHIGSYGIILMLIAFIPVHVQMVIDAPFLLGGKWVVTPVIAWLRLIVFQPLLIAWVWWHRK
ncbi:DoxX family protein [Mucilaginibacter glaciei]|uniref:DoxX family protein n=1 Tax=Mucilaginibacter glaciei TaxID=2772109 RepID=A0A926NMU5_9SPHI|nr:DoxX family protein [Mucilaginibacter glaciei]MBD1392611.1 DoxX family protein [Mucilaginibacter glaciei]